MRAAFSPFMDQPVHPSSITLTASSATSPAPEDAAGAPGQAGTPSATWECTGKFPSPTQEMTGWAQGWPGEPRHKPALGSEDPFQDEGPQEEQPAAGTAARTALSSAKRTAAPGDNAKGSKRPLPRRDRSSSAPARGFRRLRSWEQKAHGSRVTARKDQSAAFPITAALAPSPALHGAARDTEGQSPMRSGGGRAATLPSPASLSADPLLSSVPLPWDSQGLPVLICSTTAVRFSTALSSRCSGQPLRPGPRVSPAPGPCPSPRRSRSFKGIVICAFPCRLVRFCQTPGTPPRGPGQAARRRPCPTGRCCSSQHLQPCHRHVCAKGNPTTPPALKFSPSGVM